ncbi:hypothetical protein A3F03_04550 [Candidatus Roizmanbacteria bacterium RIFCSPHIGHO2_12_FULL_41_11]|uniref:Sugar ABC transporter substrate-binding protein n=2 Tax=Candidatus Roizmaniibacteriota TaxID=1752723 RepID=A0A1F7J780_9BACT|nr:MAG: hypothetical protein A3F03_04550 [Candidatus Roizmanbacteria bacterium RIFCSPHIGHO2_12_FULL_41_11]OGK51459.1 MAG: hypothetical protein A2966_00080 [Candidatus Roizmanbacteria bacterium RIFCSPLOWO2_01_FULL_41_22]
MDDKGNQDKNQSQPVTSGNVFGGNVPENIQPEEVAPDVANPNDVLGTIPPDVSQDVPVYEEGKRKYLIIAFAGIFFVIIVVLIVRYLLGNRFIFPAGTPAISDKEVTLTYWGLWEEKEIYEPLINEFQKKYPKVHIKYEKQSPQQYREKLLARKENGPDLFRFHNTWLPEIQEMVAFLPDEVMSAQEYEKTFYPVAQKDFKIGDKYYGIPLYIDGLVLVYNDTLLKQAGISAPPSAWIQQSGGGGDMLSAVGKLTVRDANNTLITSGFAAGTSDNVEHFSGLFGLLLALNGGDLKQLDNNQAVGALQLYRKFAEDNYWNSSMPNSISAFIQGKVAMIIVPSWEILVIKAQNPDLVVKVAPIPKGLDGKSISIADYWAEGVSRYSKNQLVAWQFLKFLSAYDSELKLFEQQSKTRLFGNAYSRVDLAEKLSGHEYLTSVISQANSYISLPLIARTYDGGLNDEIIQYLRNAITATSQGVDYQAALVTAKSGVDQVLSRYKIE